MADLYGYTDSSLNPAQAATANRVNDAFTQTGAQRDRMLNRYNMPALSSFGNQDALSRAQASVKDLNSRDAWASALKEAHDQWQQGFTEDTRRFDANFGEQNRRFNVETGKWETTRGDTLAQQGIENQYRENVFNRDTGRWELDRGDRVRQQGIENVKWDRTFNRDTGRWELTRADTLDQNNANNLYRNNVLGENARQFDRTTEQRDNYLRSLQPSQLSQIVQGLGTYAPMLLGTNFMGELMTKGVIPMVTGWIKNPDGSVSPPAGYTGGGTIGNTPPAYNPNLGSLPPPGPGDLDNPVGPSGPDVGGGGSSNFDFYNFGSDNPYG